MTRADLQEEGKIKPALRICHFLLCFIRTVYRGVDPGGGGGGGGGRGAAAPMKILGGGGANISFCPPPPPIISTT